MILLDANYILRFLLNDNDEMYEISKDIIKNNQCIISNEVLAEVVFVLQKVYQVSKGDITKVLTNFLQFDSIFNNEKNLIIEALKIYNEKNLDFVDCILCAKSKSFTIKTFDKKLNKCIKNNISRLKP